MALLSLFNIDWKQLAFICERLDLIDKVCQIQDFQTSIFGKIASYPDHDHEMFNLSYEPKSKILKHNLLILKVNNKFLYSQQFRAELDNLIEFLELKFNNVTRIDYALDFQFLRAGLTGTRFIELLGKNIIDLKYKGKKTIIFPSNHNEPPEYVRFGNHSSEFNVYIYNKTRELQEKKDKPYIRDQWKNCEFLENFPVFRLEISFKPDKTKFFLNKDNHNSFRNLDNILNINFHKRIFNYLIKNKFRFYYTSGKKSMVDLFYLPETQEDSNIRMLVDYDLKGSDNYIRGVINFLEKNNNEIRDYYTIGSNALSETIDILKFIYSVK